MHESVCMYIHDFKTLFRIISLINELNEDPTGILCYKPEY